MNRPAPKRVLWTLVLIVASGLIFFAMRKPAPAPSAASLPETHRTNLVLQAGRWHLPNETKAFTGLLLDTYDDGARKSLSTVRNGLLHGISRGWHTNGAQQVEEHFVSGTSYGLRTKWHPNGQKLSEVTVVAGKLHGTFRRWDEEGVLTEEIEMKDGQPDGISRSYYPSGSLKVEARLKQGQLIESHQWSDGEKIPSAQLSQSKPGA
jgi:antitoxin component YwqK of YwqJK toxin-antitoxin module